MEPCFHNEAPTTIATNFPSSRYTFPVITFKTWGGKLTTLLTSKRLLWLIIGLGIALRFAQYLANRSLWLDEAFLALNVVQRSFSQLLQPLDYEQVAPIAYLMAEKLAVVTLGDHEYALRLFPFLVGIAALPLFYAVAKSCLAPQALLISLVLFAVSEPLIYYSSEVKQYSGDVAVALLLYSLALRYVEQGKLSGRKAVLLGTGGVIAIWFSHPAIFILAGIGASLALFCMRRKAWGELGRLSLIGILWVASFAGVYFGFLRNIGTEVTELLEDQWKEAFMPFPPRSLADVRWFGQTFLRILEDPVGLGFTTIAAMVLFIGCAAIFSEKKQRGFILLSPIFFALLASGLRKYPFSGRLLLFLTPAILILVAEGMRQMLSQTYRFSIIVKVTVVGLLLFYPIQASSYHLLKKPYLREEIKPVMRDIREHWQEGDILYIYYSSIYAFKYYQERYGFAGTAYIEGIESRKNWKNYLDDLDKFRGRKRVWILLSHFYRGRGIDEKVLLHDYLDQIGTRLATVKAYGAEAYLYDLGETAPSQAVAR